MRGQRWLAGALRHEGWLVWLAGATALALVPVFLGGIGLSWDALNHHFYLGWTAEHPRFDRDFAAARYQAYQYPYLYWPIYRLAMADASGVTAGVVQALLQSAAIPATWVVARGCCPGRTWTDLVYRVAAVALGFLGLLSLSMLDTTANDMLASVPFLWSIACVVLAAEARPQGEARVLRWACASGLCAGISVAFKLSNGPLALVLPVAWLLLPGPGPRPVRRVLAAGTVTVLGFLLAYGWWGWQLWLQFGNPVYPMYDPLFEPLRALSGARP